MGSVIEAGGLLQETCCGSVESEGSWAKAVAEQGMTMDLRSTQESRSTGLIGRRMEAEGASRTMCMVNALSSPGDSTGRGKEC